MINTHCPICFGLGWVCENHPKRVWSEELGCQCGAGMPCNCVRTDGLEEGRGAARRGRGGAMAQIVGSADILDDGHQQRRRVHRSDVRGDNGTLLDMLAAVARITTIAVAGKHRGRPRQRLRGATDAQRTRSACRHREPARGGALLKRYSGHDWL
jgi:hypothetical protein